MPSSPRVSSSASSPSCARSACARAVPGRSRSSSCRPPRRSSATVRRDHAARPCSATSRRPWDRPARACPPRAPGRSSWRCARGRPCRSPTGSPRRRPARPRLKSASLEASTSLGGRASRSRCAAAAGLDDAPAASRGRTSSVAMQARLDAGFASAASPAGRPPRPRPTTESSRVRAPSAAQLLATLAAPPSRSSWLRKQHHRHRRLGRNARDVAEPVAVEHHVAHHQHARLLRIRCLHCLPADREILEAERADHGRIVQVAAVEDRRRLQVRLQRGEIRRCGTPPTR